MGEKMSKVYQVVIYTSILDEEKLASYAALAGLDDPVIDIAITPDRADCLGVRGIARDLASAGLGRLSSFKKIKLKQNFSQPVKISITKEKNQGCMSFGACYIRNIKNKEEIDLSACDATCHTLL